MAGKEGVRRCDEVRSWDRILAADKRTEGMTMGGGACIWMAQEGTRWGGDEGWGDSGASEGGFDMPHTPLTRPLPLPTHGDVVIKALCLFAFLMTGEHDKAPVQPVGRNGVTITECCLPPGWTSQSGRVAWDVTLVDSSRPSGPQSCSPF